MTTFSPKEILCGIDLSSSAPQVLRWARLLAEAYGANVDVLHSFWSEPPRYFTSGQIEALAAEAAQEKIRRNDEFKSLVRQVFNSEISYQAHLAEGHPVEEIARQLARAKPDLLVLGSHGRSGLARLMLGSVAETVVRQARCPTLIVRGAEAAKPALERILCPVGFTELSRRSLAYATDLAAKFGADLEVLHAAAHAPEDREKLREQLCRWVPESARAHCHLTETVRHGDPAEQIILAAREKKVDLIVLGAEHKPFLEFTAFGTTTERVLRHSPSSLLVLPWKSEAQKG